MTDRQPYFFKRWRARELPESDRNRPLADAGLATSAAPTYFPSHEIWMATPSWTAECSRRTR